MMISNKQGCTVTGKLHVSPVFSQFFGTCVRHGGWSLQPSRPLTCLGLLLPWTPTAGDEQGAPFMRMWMSTAATAAKNLPQDPLASRGQKNKCPKNTLHNALCNTPPKLIAGAEGRKNWAIMLRPCSIVFAPWHEGHTGGLRGFTNRNATRCDLRGT